jgi:hypothetical protein
MVEAAKLARYEELVRATFTLFATSADGYGFDPVYVDDLRAVLSALDKEENK